MGIVRFALRLPHTFYVLAALILFLGGIAIRTMPTDIFPEINIPVVTVIWTYTGLSTPEMLAACHDCGMKLMILETHKDPEAFRKIIAGGADLVNLDHGDLFLEVQRQAQGKP